MRVEVGACAEVMAAMPEASIDAVVCDPPYGLGFMGKAWDTFGGGADHAMRRNPAVDAVNAGVSRQGGRQRAGADFQKRQARDARSYQEWCEAWGAEALRVLRPGGYLLAFGGTRTYHRLVSGLENAGFEIRDTIAWLYGSGFPKHASTLKPAHEPIVLARKPLVGTIAANVQAHGTGALNIDGCRIEGEVPATGQGVGRTDGTAIYANGRPIRAEPREFVPHITGRWPANVVLDREAAAMLDEQSGTLTSGANPTRRGTDKFRDVYGDFAGQEECEPARGVDVGGASRFFYCAKADTAERNAGLGGDGGLFADPDAPDRNDHPTVKPISLMRWLVRLVTPPGGVVLDPFCGSGTTGCAAALEGFRFVGIERDEGHARIARARIAHWSLGAVA